MIGFGVSEGRGGVGLCVISEVSVAVKIDWEGVMNITDETDVGNAGGAEVRRDRVAFQVGAMLVDMGPSMVANVTSNVIGIFTTIDENGRRFLNPVTAGDFTT